MRKTDPHTLAFLAFFQERPSLSKKRFAQELNFDYINFQKILSNGRTIPQHRRGDFLRLMKKYGYTTLS